MVFEVYSKSTFFACAGITLYDIIIDKIHFSKDARYQKALVADSRHALEETKNDIWNIFPTVSSRAHFLYSQAAYWVAVGAITLDEAADVYPEKADYNTEMFQLFNNIQQNRKRRRS